MKAMVKPNLSSSRGFAGAVMQIPQLTQPVWDTPSGPDSASSVAPTIRVMLIDDHPTVLWGLVNLIESQKPHMEVAGTAQTCTDALETVGKLSPDVVLLDLGMGETSSIDILPSLLSSSRSRVLIFTGERDQIKLDLAISSGASGILNKDASAEQIFKAIKKIARGEIWLDRDTLGRMFNEFRNPGLARKNDPELEKQSALTVRERKIIQAIVESNGALNKTMAQRLFISEHTLRNHLTSIYQKLGVSNRLELYVYAVKHRLGEPSER